MSGIFNFENNDLYRAACEQGATFNQVLIIKDDENTLKDLTGYSSSMQVRETAASSSPLVSLSSSADSGISIDTEKSTITITISASDTADLEPGVYVYDLEVTKEGVVTRLLQGDFEVTAEVTR